MANVKEIIRSERFEIRMSPEEKELFTSYANEIGMNPSRLARNIIMQQSESILNKPFYIPITKAYLKYLEVTKQTDILERIKDPN